MIFVGLNLVFFRVLTSVLGNVNLSSREFDLLFSGVQTQTVLESCISCS